MAVFAIFEHPGKHPDKTVFVKEGFSAGAFVFTVFWTLWHRMWVMSAVLTAVYAMLMLAPTYLGLSEGLAGALNFGVSILLGFEAQEFRAASLRRSGYDEVGIVMGTDREEAELKHGFASPRAAAPSSPAPRPMTEPADTLGLFGSV